jgi:ADP-ribose pyrophosphatase YjhB (NUDIX family)
MNYCSQCGSDNISFSVPEGDNRPRFICAACQTIHYQNPNIIAGCIPTWQDKVLLCRRAIEPRYGLWTLPAGFMENGETTEQAATRETWEEAQAKMQDTQLYAVFSIPHINQVYMMFRGELSDLNYAAGIESLEVELFAKKDIPWDTLAFPVVKQILKQYWIDRSAAHFPVCVGLTTATEN